MIREHAVISESISEDVVWLCVALDAVAVLPVESLEAQVVVIVGGPPVERLCDDDAKVPHLELDLLADIGHDFTDRLWNHLF